MEDKAFLPLSLFLLFVLAAVVHGALMSVQPAGLPEIPKSLYADSDPILQLDGSSFSNQILRSNRSYFIEFYLSWCGHCRRFAPLYLRFAEDVKGWGSVVKVAAVNCAEESAKSICLAHNIQMVPVVKYYPRGSVSFENALTVVAPAQQSVAGIRRVMLNFVLAEYNKSRFSNWPMFDYLKGYTSVLPMWSEVDSSVNFLGIVFERHKASGLTEQDYIGAELLMDFSSKPWISLRRAENSHPLVPLLGLVELPAVVIFQRGVNEPVYQSELHRLFANDILSLAQKLNLDNGSSAVSVPSLPLIAPLSPSNGSAPSKTFSTNPEELAKKFFVSETDLLLALKHALRRDINFKQNITGESLTALKNVISTFAKYYPQSEVVRQTLTRLSLPSSNANLDRLRRVRGLLADVNAWLGNRSLPYRSDFEWFITSKEWLAKITELEEKHGNPFPRREEYLHCKGSSALYRGYTCGLWQNFHALTVHAYLTDSIGAGAINFSPLKVLYAIRDYIKHFFACYDCQQHFMSMASSELKMEDWVRYPSDVVLWLWRAHNQVNRRLAGDETEDPDFPKRQFPPSFLCPRCESSPGNWALREVMRYLTIHYTNIRPHEENARFSRSTTTLQRNRREPRRLLDPPALSASSPFSSPLDSEPNNGLLWFS